MTKIVVTHQPFEVPEGRDNRNLVGRAAFAPASAETFRHTPDGRARLSDEVAAGVTFGHGSRALQPDDPTRRTGPERRQGRPRK